MNIKCKWIVSNITHSLDSDGSSELRVRLTTCITMDKTELIIVKIGSLRRQFLAGK